MNKIIKVFFAQLKKSWFSTLSSIWLRINGAIYERVFNFSGQGLYSDCGNSPFSHIRCHNEFKSAAKVLCKMWFVLFLFGDIGTDPLPLLRDILNFPKTSFCFRNQQDCFTRETICEDICSVFEKRVLNVKSLFKYYFC